MRQTSDASTPPAMPQQLPSSPLSQSNEHINIKTEQETLKQHKKKQPKLMDPSDWADSIGSLSVISALIFGFSAAVLTNVQQPDGISKQKEIYFGAFILLLCIAIGLSFIGLAISSIMYHNVKGFQAYGLVKKGLKEYEQKSYVVKNVGYYFIYISWAALIVSLMMYCWVYFDDWIAITATVLTTIMLVSGILMGAHLANIYAKFSGDENIFHVWNPDQIQKVMHHKSVRIQMTDTNALNQGHNDENKEERDGDGHTDNQYDSEPL